MFGSDFTIPPHPGARGQRKWFCRLCGWILDESVGSPEHGIAPGLALEDLPEGWRCPECGAGPGEFEPFLD